jgi:hypothetical protein
MVNATQQLINATLRNDNFSVENVRIRSELMIIAQRYNTKN